MSEKIQAVANDDVEKLLKSLNLLGELQSNNLFCSVCGKLLTLDSVGCVYPFEKKINVCCDKLICLQRTIDIITPLRKIEGSGNGMK